MSAFDKLLADDLARTVATVASAEATASALRESETVKALRQALGTGMIDVEAGVEFARALLGRIETRRRFFGDAALAALAIAVETVASPGAEELLNGLAKLNIAELPKAARIARLALRQRALTLAPTTVRVFQLSTLWRGAQQLQVASAPAPVAAGRTIPEVGRIVRETNRTSIFNVLEQVEYAPPPRPAGQNIPFVGWAWSEVESLETAAEPPAGACKRNCGIYHREN